MQRIIVVGGGFGGLWSAVGAARRLREAGAAQAGVEVVLIDPHPHHRIRVRNYEADLASTRVPYAEVLDPIGVRHIMGEVTGIDADAQTVAVREGGETRPLPYARLVVATGSRLARPPIPGLQHAFDIDTYDGARRLRDHVGRLSALPPVEGRFTALVIGAGLTGIELALELPHRLREAAGSGEHAACRTILADRNAQIGAAMGGAQPVIERACRELGIEMWPGFSVASIDASGATLTDGTYVPASTVVWCGGMRAHPLNASLPVTLDAMGRLPVDTFMRVHGIPNVFAAGDAAEALIDGEHPSVMSCQHARPMGRFAGHNAAAEWLGEPMLPLSIDWYTTILDLGPWGAVYTEGWDRRLVAEGEVAKKTKFVINHARIYPPRTGNAEEILLAGAPVVQRPPAYGDGGAPH
ncbi:MULTISPECIES: NAD(P)/FAD-dependent oxidoreductase [unclassified Cupriavidus]|uniref:NAD(P)/FAD-dependent oxidoreductase n=1 Tax=unclassified Cupriavidus TaxID=2640874 RepID=UPI00313F032A